MTTTIQYKPVLKHRVNKHQRLLQLVLGIAAILLWQGLFLKIPPPSDPSHQLKASSGLQYDREFVYFLYYKNLWPIATINRTPLYSTQGADKELSRGQDLRTEFGHTLRTGEYGKTYLHLPEAYLKGTAEAPSVRTANIFGFVGSLCLLYTSFVLIGRPRLGAILVVLFGSNPFLLQEIYYRANVFGWPAISAMTVLALNLPIFVNRPQRRWWIFLPPLLTGVFLALVKEIRTEPFVVIAGLPLLYLTLNAHRIWKRLLLVVLLATAYLTTNSALGHYFESKLKEADAG